MKTKKKVIEGSYIVTGCKYWAGKFRTIHLPCEDKVEAMTVGDTLLEEGFTIMYDFYNAFIDSSVIYKETIKRKKEQ